MDKLGHVSKCAGAWLCMSAEIHAPLLSLLLFCHSVLLASNYNGTSKWECVFLCCCPFSCVQLLHPHAIEIYKMIGWFAGISMIKPPPIKYTHVQ